MLLKKYFDCNFNDLERREAARQSISDDLEYIAAVLWAADGIVFECNRAISAALGIETPPVRAFVQNTRKLYGAFLPEQPAPEKGGAAV